MLVVSDTSPVSSLLQIGRCELLRDLFGLVRVPTAVRDELAKFHAALPPFLEAREIVNRGQAQSLLADLDLGEAEAIVLAIELQADFLLIDERRGRSIATRSGVTVIGLVGVLLLAKQRGMIISLRDCFDELRTKAGFYLSDSLLAKALEAAGEGRI